MRRIREVMRLRHSVGASAREIALSVGIARSTVAEYLYRSDAADLRWPLPEGLSDEELERRLFPPSADAPETGRPLPNWSEVKRELGKKGVTLLLLWREYKEKYPDGYGYSRFVDLFGEWESRSDLRMKQRHKAGEKEFVDFAGPKMRLTDPETGEIREVPIFVSALGASQRLFAKAYVSQTLESWLSGIADSFEYYGALPEILVPDNPKSCVTSPDRYEPVVNPSFAEFARHYGVAVIPARPRKPRDKAKVENGVLQVERWILAPLRDRTFFSLEELNRAIAEELERLDARVMKESGLSRRELFEQIDRPAMRSLNVSRYVLALWKSAKVAPDYCVEFEGHRYSVPFPLVGKKVDLRTTAQAVEIFHGSKRICGHPRSISRRGFSIEPSHMPVRHKEFAEWTPERIANWASQTGTATQEFVTRMMEANVHPEQAFRAAMGVISLAKRFTPERLEAACARANRFGARGYRNVKTILEKGLDRENPSPPPEPTLPFHLNVRGSEYFAQESPCVS